MKPAGFWNTNRLGLSGSNADDAGNMSIRKYEFSLLEHLLDRVVAAHTAIDIRFSIDNDAFEKCQCGRRGALYRAVVGRIFGGLICAEKTRDSGVHVQCRKSQDEAKVYQLYSTGNDGRTPTFYILWHGVASRSYAHLLAQSALSQSP